MRNYAHIIVLLLPASLICSCRTSPRVAAINANNLEEAVQAEKVVVVSSAGKINGSRFRECFVDEFARLTQGSKKRLSIMTDSEFANSAYSQPETWAAQGETLFVFLKVASQEPGNYGTYTVKYLLEVKHIGRTPFLSEEIDLGIGNAAIEARFWGGIELARIVFEELNKRNIL